MSILPRAVAIADVIGRATIGHTPVEVEDKADELFHSQPEAEIP